MADIARTTKTILRFWENGLHKNEIKNKGECENIRLYFHSDILALPNGKIALLFNQKKAFP